MFQPFIPHTQEEFPLPPTTNLWTIQDLHKSGIMDYHGVPIPHVHFIRDTTRRVVQYLNEQYESFLFSPNHRLLPAAQIFGGSGDGKSTETFGWFHNIEANRIWIHNDTQNGKCFIITRIFWSGANHGWIWESAAVNSIEEVLLVLNDPTHRWLVAVFDGRYSKDDINCLFQICLDRKIFGIKCTSGQSGQLISSRHFKFEFGNCFTVTGFTKAEYISAEQVLHPGRTRDEILEMHYYAGASARYYFQYFGRIRSFCHFLCFKISAIPHSSDFLAGAVGSASDDAVNSLAAYLDPTLSSSPVVVSKYVTRLLADKVSRGFIESAKNALPDNDSWQGWCTELDFYSRVRSQIANRLNLVLKVNTNMVQDQDAFNHRVSRVVRFDGLEQLNPATSTPPYSADQVLFVPTRYDSRGYDAMHIRCEPIADGRIRVHVDIFQITRAKAHTKKLESTELFLQTLFPQGWEFAEFVILYRIVTPYRNLSQFRLNPKSRSGIPEITNKWDAQFSWPDSFSVVYFDEDIPFS